jgi:hypothetical protein
MGANAPDWAEEFPVGITVSGKDETILYMNGKSAATFAGDGGASLVGKDLMACHGERSKLIIRRILETEKPNVYTIEKKGVKKLIYQAPWYENGAAAGLVELSIEIPWDMPHFKRD